MQEKRRVILYISMSLDGFIADENDNLDFLSLVTEEGEDYGYSTFVDKVDTVIIGRKTYDKVISMGFDYPHTDKDVYIISRENHTYPANFKSYSGSLKDLIANLKTKEGKDIYCDGGAQIVNELLRLNLIDDMIISIIPVLLGGGVKLFNDDRPQQMLEFMSAKNYPKGLLQVHYKCKKD